MSAAQTTINEVLTGRFLFFDLGRNKAKFQASLNGESDFWNAIRPHLMSNDLEFDFDDGENQGFIWAGFRCVGKFEKLVVKDD